MNDNVKLETHLARHPELVSGSPVVETKISLSVKPFSTAGRFRIKPRMTAGVGFFVEFILNLFQDSE